MAKAILYVRPSDGGISIVFPSGNIKEAERDVPPATPYVEIKKSDIPSDREFRDAWVLDSGNFSVDISKAKEIKKQVLRQERKQKLQDLDVAFQRAIEENKPTTAIVAEKNRLRDITLEVDAASSISQIKAVSI